MQTAEKLRGRLDLAGDAERVMAAVMAGGVALIPGDVGYGVVARSPAALVRIFETKKRTVNKRHGMLGSYEHHREIHRVDARAREIIDTIALDYELPLSIVAPYDPDNRFTRQLDEDTLRGSTVNGTVAVVVNQGAFYGVLGRLAHAAGVTLLGSSANLSGTGIKSKVEDIEPEIIELADVIIDHGLARYHFYRRASTLINFETMQIIRTGACYEIIADILQRRFGIEVPQDPGFDVLPSGILWEAPAI